MSLLRVPVVNRDQLQALRSLLRLDFTRALRNALTESKVVPLQCVTILRLTEYMNQAEQPLIVIAAMMQHTGKPTSLLPLDKERFAFFSRLLDISLGTEDFPGLTEDQLEPVLAPMRVYVTELKALFEASATLDEDAIRGKVQDDPGPPSGLMN